MECLEPDIQELKAARRKSAAKIQELLQELELSEREFEALTEKLKVTAETAPPV